MVKQYRKACLLSILALVLFAFAFFAIKTLVIPQESFSYAMHKMNIDQMAETSEMIIIGKPTGKVESMKVDDDVVFILTEVRIESVIKGNVSKGDLLTILETEGVPIDIVMAEDATYLLFVEPYVPGIKAAAGNYVITQANQGIYRIDQGQKVYEYDEDGKEKSTGDRINKINSLFRNKLTSDR